MPTILPCLVALVCSLSVPLQEQVAAPVFGCARAVEISIHRKPPFHWEQIRNTAVAGFTGSDTHSFNFGSQWPFTRVTFYLAATIGEEPAGSAAGLTVYAVTRSAGTPGGTAAEKIWELVLEDRPAEAGEDTGPSLRLDSQRVAECFNRRSGGHECSFASIERAAPQDDIPFFDLSFSEDLGGANATNTATRHLLFDFRTATPAVGVFGECLYNEGGGACTAFDSAQVNRSDLGCKWAPASSDFICRENSDTGHRSFYLIRNGIAPVAGEEESVADAILKLAATASDRGVTVRGVGEVRIITRVPLPNARTALLLAAPGNFYLASGSGRGGLIAVGAHGLSRDTGGHPKTSAELIPPPPALEDETPDVKPNYSVRQLYSDRALTVFQVVVKTTWNRLYWVGIESAASGTFADAVELAGGTNSYEGCSVEVVPESVAKISNITRPFRASVEIQPETETSAEEDVTWKGAHFSGPEEQPIIDCTRTGAILWRKGLGFVTQTTSPSTCQKSEKPHFITVTDSGDLKLSERLPPP